MSRIMIFGAGGRLGRLAVTEALGRGHDVTAAVRDPSAHADLGASAIAASAAQATGVPGRDGFAASRVLDAAGAAATDAIGVANVVASGALRVVAADATDAASVAAVAAGHDAVIASLYQDALPHDVFYAGAAGALLAGLARAGVGRLLFVGMASNLESAPGVRIMDAPGFPLEHRPFALGHTAALHVLRASESPVDWLMLTPPMAFAADGPRTGRYRTGGDAVIGEQISYADFAIALLDEIETPAHHRTRIAVAA